jgi:hypothetical protein
MNGKHKLALVLLAATVVIGLAAAQTGHEVLSPTGSEHVSIAAVQENPGEFLEQRITVEGWYQGGLLRSKNPVCANTREGVQRVPYSFIYVEVPEGETLYTDVKYRFTGVMRDSDEIGRTVPGSQPVLVPGSIEKTEREPDECRFRGNRTGS